MMELPERIQNKLVNIALATAHMRDMPAYQWHAIERQAREIEPELNTPEVDAPRPIRHSTELKERGEK